MARNDFHRIEAWSLLLAGCGGVCAKRRIHKQALATERLYNRSDIR